MKILAIETSCDETAVALFDAEGGFKSPSFAILGNTLLSQAHQHAEYGGVYPTLAKREHSRNLIPVLTQTLKEAGMFSAVKTNDTALKVPQTVRTILAREEELLEEFVKVMPNIKKPDIDAIAVTQGPGLEPALWVGLNFAKALSALWDIPLVPIDHMEGHILSVLAHTGANTSGKESKTSIQFPALALLISGGHTQLVFARDWLSYEILGETRDDAVGEAFDKVARLLGLPYPGGPEISRLAEQERQKTPVSQNIYKLPKPMQDSPDHDFSFSGLKTAVLYTIKKIEDFDEKTKQTIAREFEDAVVKVLVTKTERALKEYNPKTLIIGGGVIANKTIREAFENLIPNYSNTTLHIPDRALATDNAVMIGIAGYFRYLNGEHLPPAEAAMLRADGNLRLDAGK